jgi:hypothetical protein
MSKLRFEIPNFLYISSKFPLIFNCFLSFSGQCLGHYQELGSGVGLMSSVPGLSDVFQSPLTPWAVPTRWLRCWMLCCTLHHNQTRSHCAQKTWEGALQWCLSVSGRRGVQPLLHCYATSSARKAFWTRVWARAVYQERDPRKPWKVTGNWLTRSWSGLQHKRRAGGCVSFWFRRGWASPRPHCGGTARARTPFWPQGRVRKKHLKIACYRIRAYWVRARFFGYWTTAFCVF